MAEGPVGLAAQRPLPSPIFVDLHSPNSNQPSSQIDGMVHPLTIEQTLMARLSRSEESHLPDVNMEVDKPLLARTEEEPVTTRAKKRKGQRFYCRDYPPCDLSFTRSEHLARHVRKHTGERPFECHCSRKFSRLDNLRQHAQTVHMHEEIPPDSLAASTMRSQRAIRTDSMLPPNIRSRSSTMNSQSSIRRGHSRTDSISSMMSNGSAYTTYFEDDSRPRPPPLLMAHDPTLRTYPEEALTDAQRIAHNRQESYNALSSGSGTPTSAYHSSATGTPYYSHRSSLATPGSPLDYGALSRRSSMPIGYNPFQNPYGATSHAMNQSGIPQSPQHGGIMASPTGSSFSGFSDRGDHLAESDPRRRTWHMATNYAETVANHRSYGQDMTISNRLSIGSNPSLPRLPGIDDLLKRPPTPNPPTQTQQIPISNRLSTSSDNLYATADARRHVHDVDRYLHQNLRTMHLGRAGQRPGSGDWSRGFVAPEVSSRPSTAQSLGPPFDPHLEASQTPTSPIHPALQAPGLESPSASDKAARRRGWIGGPTSTPQTRKTPEDSSSSDGVKTPGNGSMHEYAPAIREGGGSWTESRPTSMMAIDPQLKMLQDQLQIPAAAMHPLQAESETHNEMATPRPYTARYDLPSSVAPDKLHSLNTVASQEAKA